jgi:hypothetical protein
MEERWGALSMRGLCDFGHSEIQPGLRIEPAVRHCLRAMLAWCLQSQTTFPLSDLPQFSTACIVLVSLTALFASMV